MNTLREFPCPQCSGQLLYDADALALKCRHCKTVIPVQKGAEKVVENSIREFLQLPAPSHPLEAAVKYSCSRCGSESSWPDNDPAFECPHCHNVVVNADAYHTFPVQPTGIIPFLITKDEG